MNNINLSVVTLRLKAPTIAVAGTLLIAGPALAGPADRSERMTLREMRDLNPGFSVKELRQMFRSQRAATVHNNAGMSAPAINLNVNSHLHGNGLNQRSLNESARSIDVRSNHAQRMANFGNRSQFVSENGKAQSVTRGLELDLTSDERSIVLGENLFANASSYTIASGGEEKVLTAGSSVSAAEYVALQQVITSGAQSLVVDGAGRGIDGEFNLNSINDGGGNLRAASLVIPESVVAFGDFSRKADGLRVTNDLSNHGSLFALANNRNFVRIGARDINNSSGALISTDVPTASGNGKAIDLSLSADRDINNAGLIASSGELELSAGRAVKNSASGVIRAGGSISMVAANVDNAGVIASGKDVNLAGMGNTDLAVNNNGGVISAASGAINVRFEGYGGEGNSTILGGDLFSREVNLFSGLGSSDVFVNQLTGVVTSSGTAAHVSSNTDILTIGSQCLVGDPTYFNTGDIVLGGNIIVGEDLAIIAGKNITTNQTSLTIAALDGGGTGQTINIIAGANITSGTGPIGVSPLPGQPPINNNATGNVTIDGASATGGTVDLSFATTKLVVDTGAGAPNKSAGDITIAAFKGSDANSGAVLLNSGSTLIANGDGTGVDGNITVVAGGSSAGKSIILGAVTSRSGGAGFGNININNSQPVSTDLGVVTFDTTGAIITNNKIVGVTAAGAGNGIVTVGDVSSSGDVSIAGGGVTTVSSVNASGMIADDNSGIVSITSENDIVNVIGLIDISATGSGSSNSLFVDSNSDVSTTALNGVSAFAGPTGLFGGFIQILNKGDGGISLSGKYLTGGANSGNVIINGGDGEIFADDVIVDAGSLGVGSNGSVNISGGNIVVQDKLLVLSSIGLGSGSVVIETGAGGIVTGGGDLTVEANKAIDLRIANNLIDADGVGFAGGDVRLDAPMILFNDTTSANPLVISANGDANFAGGSVYIEAPGNTQATVIGTPQKIPKPPADFLNLSAVAGDSAVSDGGSISVIVGGSIFAGPGSLDVSASSVGGNGGNIILSSGGTPSKKGSPIVVEGELRADGINGGNGGNITITSASKKNFVIDGTKVPKNGVFGVVGAQGAFGTGSVSIINTAGGIQLGRQFAVRAGDIYLTAFGKGRIFGSNGFFIDDALVVSTDLGDIELTFDAASVQTLSNFGDIELRSTNQVTNTKVTSISGGDYFLSSAGGVDITSITTADGDVELIVDQGNLNVNGSVGAKNGGIILQNDDLASGAITVASSVTIETSGKGDDVTIAIGEVKGKVQNPSPPFVPSANFKVNNTGKGLVFFGQNPAGVVAPSPTVTLNAINKDVILNNASTGGQLITLGDNVTVTADPPSKMGLALSAVPPYNPRSTGDMSSANVDFSYSDSEMLMFNGSSMSRNLLAADLNRMNLTSTLPVSTTIIPADAFDLSPVVYEQKSNVAISQNERTTNAFVWSDEDLGLNSTMMIGRSTDTTSGARVESAKLRKGSVLFSPSKRTQIETPLGTIAIEKGAIAFVFVDGSRLAVYDLHDSNRGAVSISTGSTKLQLVPGRCAVITDKVHHGFEKLNPMETVGYRSLSTHVVNGLKTFNAEFSTPHVINCIEPLQAVLSGNKDAAKRMRDRLMKTSAVLMHLNASREEFRAYAEPNVTAMR